MSDAREKIVYLMRGLPSSGKSHAARQVAGESGIVCETDEFFLTEVGTDSTAYDYDPARLDEARQWNFARFSAAVAAGVSPIVVDRGNSLSLESQRYARHAADAGYRVELREPASPWWQEIRVLLKYKRFNGVVLREWAERLAQMNRSSHRAPVEGILRTMAKWRYDLTVDEILAFAPDPSSVPEGDSALVAANDDPGGPKEDSGERSEGFEEDIVLWVDDDEGAADPADGDLIAWNASPVGGGTRRPR